MADNLTKKLQEELARRGKVVSSNDIEKILAKNNLSSQINLSKDFSQPQQQPQQIGQQQTLWSELGGVPDWYEEDSKSMSDNTLSNALGAGLWSFADTALFGVPGAITDEEDFIDFDDPVAKWLSAGGSFLGFVAGAPLKAGVKLGQAVTTKIAPKFGKQGVEPSVGKMVAAVYSPHEAHKEPGIAGVTRELNFIEALTIFLTVCTPFR